MFLGGYAESSLMPNLAIKMLKSKDYYYINFLENLTNAIAKKVKRNGRIMLVHCTSYSDDRQVMQCLGDELKSKGFEVIYAAADHVNFQNNEAFSILDGNEGKIDAIFRFTPIEWLIDMKPKKWAGYFNTTTISCNHPIAIYAQTKRFPLVWNELEKKGLNFKTWRLLLPDTRDVKEAKGLEGYIYKPANRKSRRRYSYKRGLQRW